jgi:hypothetical protein
VNRRTCCTISLIALLLLSAACAKGKSNRIGGPQKTVRKANVTEYMSEGKTWYIGASIRASRMAGPTRDLIPVNMVIVNKDAGSQRISRESLVLETSDGRLLPVISYEQFEKEYRDDRADERAGSEWIDRHTGRFPEPPFEWMKLDFFPIRNTSVNPRDTIETRGRQLVHGYVYFGKPSDDYEFPEGKYKLLFTPSPGPNTIVVELFPF